MMMPTFTIYTLGDDITAEKNNPELTKPIVDYRLKIAINLLCDHYLGRDYDQPGRISI